MSKDIWLGYFDKKLIVYPEDLVLELKPDFEESIAERTVMRRQNQEGQGSRVLTPEQILSRLPVCLAQLKAGNNSEELKNEIRELSYSLYRSKRIIQNNLETFD